MGAIRAISVLDNSPKTLSERFRSPTIAALRARVRRGIGDVGRTSRMRRKGLLLGGHPSLLKTSRVLVARSDAISTAA